MIKFSGFLPFLRRGPLSWLAILLLLLGLGGCASSAVDSSPAAEMPVRASAVAPMPVPAPTLPAPPPENALPGEAQAVAAAPVAVATSAPHRGSARPVRARRAASQTPEVAFLEAETPPPELVEASLAYSVTREMHIGRSYPVELWLDQQVGEADLGRNLALKIKPAAGEVDTGRLVVELGNEVVAELLVFNGEFEVNPAGPIVQPVLPKVPLRWQWLVKPLKTGELKLQVRVAARISGRESGVSTPYLGSVIVTSWPPATFEEFIELLKSWVRQVDSLFALLGTSLAAIAAFFFKRGNGEKTAE
ncbi:hypothetical protein [Quatrionicoccus australiensis]|uniref:hypothetical protein n=1 Tax=Quatrionicoccus australiensis TaxID=138118 RepID=UPI001CF85877|nr:hypothetical protein [Quatrionicoccus australiensis]UCV16062.1 hypothetical protein KI612_04995 [Quatrionicoccus australiensis]